MPGARGGRSAPPERRIRLRLEVGVPVALALVAMASGIGAVEAVYLLEPGLGGEGAARLWASGIVVTFSFLIGGLGLLFVRILQEPLEEVIHELGRRVDDRPGMGASFPEGSNGAVPVAGREEGLVPAEEVAWARRTLDEYLRRLDEYRIDAALLEEIEEVLLVLDVSGRVRYANRRAREAFDVAPDAPPRPFEAVVGREPANLALRSLVRGCLDDLRANRAGERRTTVTEDLVVELPGGDSEPMRARAYLASEGFRVGGLETAGGPALLLALQPASEQERASLRRERRDRLAALGTLVSEVAHEVRNPLGSLRGMTELLEEQLPRDDPKREHLDAIADRIERVIRYLDEVLDYSQPRRIRRETLRVEALLEAAVEAMADRAARRGLELRLRVEDDCPATIPGDGDRLHQVLENLLQNALEHADEGGRVTVVAAAGAPGGRSGTGEGEADGVERLAIRVHNTGSYVEPERREEIFRPFSSSREGGTGLGLSVSRYLARLHGGDVEVESEPGEGTAFVLLLPVTGPGPEEGPPGPGRSS